MIYIGHIYLVVIKHKTWSALFHPWWTASQVVLTPLDAIDSLPPLLVGRQLLILVVSKWLIAEGIDHNLHHRQLWDIQKSSCNEKSRSLVCIHDNTITRKIKA